jgi:hypothetical protein
MLAKTNDLQISAVLQEMIFGHLEDPGCRRPKVKSLSHGANENKAEMHGRMPELRPWRENPVSCRHSFVQPTVFDCTDEPIAACRLLRARGVWLAGTSDVDTSASRISLLQQVELHVQQYRPNMVRKMHRMTS